MSGKSESTTTIETEQSIFVNNVHEFYLKFICKENAICAVKYHASFFKIVKHEWSGILNY